MKLSLVFILLIVLVGIAIPKASGQTNDPTEFVIKMSLHGLGNSGDTLNPTNGRLSNKDPDRFQREVVISVFTSSNQLITTKTGTMTYNYDTLTFNGLIDMDNLASGSYIIKIRTPSYLQKRVPGTIKVTKGTPIIIPDVALIAGDINNDNRIDVLDYNVFRGCYSDTLPATFCDDKRLIASDLSDDGRVNALDYNLFIREIGQQGD